MKTHTVEDLLAVIVPPPQNENEQEELARALIGLIEVGKKTVSLAETPQDREKRYQSLLKAGAAICALPNPYLDTYGGIGRELLRIAKDLQEMDENSSDGAELKRGRPREIGKIRIINVCRSFLRHFERHEGIGSPATKDVLKLAQALWKHVGVGDKHTTLKSWTMLSARNEERLWAELDGPSDPEGPKIQAQKWKNYWIRMGEAPGI